MSSLDSDCSDLHTLFFMTPSKFVAFPMSSKAALAIPLEPTLLVLILKVNFLDSFVEDNNHDISHYPPH